VRNDEVKGIRRRRVEWEEMDGPIIQEGVIETTNNSGSINRKK